MQAVEAATLDWELGVVGDHYQGQSGIRQVTVMAMEHLAAIAQYLGLEEATPEQLRRNLVVSGVNLAALKERRFRVGDAVLEATGECHPCSRMEETLGVGGYNAVRGHGGVTARVVCGGVVRVGDAVVRMD